MLNIFYYFIFRCKSCGNKQGPKANRLKQHHEKCSKEPVTITEPTPVKRPREESPPPAKRQAFDHTVTIQPQVDGHFIKTNKERKDQLDEEMAKFFYACNIPFAVAEHPQFVNMIEKLRPGYTPPNRKAIGGYLLDQVHDQQQQQMKREISGKDATLIQDGWSTVHNEPVIASCLLVEGNEYYLDSHDTGTMTKSADNCKNLVLESKALAKNMYNCNVSKLVTDNAKNMEKMREDLKEQDPDLIAYGCGSHVANLLGQDITPPNIMKHVVEVQKYFRNHHLPAAWLKETPGAHKPQLPGETRWNSQFDCLTNYVQNRPHYQQIIEEQEHEYNWDKNIIKKVNDYAIYKNTKDLIEQLQPVAIALDTLQSNTTNIADSCDIWLKLLNNPVLEPHKQAVSKRVKMALSTEHLVAYKLHHKYRGENLSPEQEEKVSNYLIQKDASFMETLIAYQAKAAPFPASYFTDHAHNSSPVTWWKAIQAHNINSEFANLACKLLSAPASSASIERVFSNYSYIFNKIRNRLTIDKASKLVFCYRMLRGTKDIDY